MLQKWKLKQLNTKAILGEEYNDYNLVMTSEFGSPLESRTIRVSFNKLIEEHHLPKVVFHSLRHSSVTYELNQIGIKIDMYRQEYRFTPAFAFIQAV